MVYKILLAVLALSLTLFAQETVLDDYIDQALNSNPALKQSEFNYKKSIAALKEARGLFLPNVSIEARYSRADGGRLIEFPIGDLLNPIYQTLNLLTGIPAFPTDLPNESFRFFREREHETKVRVVQPVFQPQILYNHNIRKHLSEVEKASRDAYARQLVAEVKTAYYNYLTAIQVVDLAEQTEKVLQENLRVSQSLYDNDKVTIDAVYRARTELSRLEQRQAEADKLYELSKAYFNFLLNRSLDTSVATEDVRIPQTRDIQLLEDLQINALRNREELRQLQSAINAQRNGVNLNRSTLLPGLTFVFDYGYQGEEYIFNDDYDYWMASGILSWNLFSGGQNKARIQKAKLEQARLETQKHELQNQIKLDVLTAFQNLKVVTESIEAAENELKSAEQNFEIVGKKYVQGMTPQIEYLDAQNTLTQAQLNAVMVNYDYFIKKAELEKAAATFEFDLEN